MGPRSLSSYGSIALPALPVTDTAGLWPRVEEVEVAEEATPARPTRVTVSACGSGLRPARPVNPHLFRLTVEQLAGLARTSV